MPKRSATRTRRTPEQLIEDLQKKIEQVKARAARAKVKKDPALRHINGAVRSIDKAAKATGDHAVRKALEDARATQGACLAMNGAKGVLKPKRAAAKPTGRGGDGHGHGHAAAGAAWADRGRNREGHGQGAGDEVRGGAGGRHRWYGCARFWRRNPS